MPFSMAEITMADALPQEQVSTHDLADLPRLSNDGQQPQFEGAFEPALDVDAPDEKLLHACETAATAPKRSINTIRSLQRLLGWTARPNIHDYNDIPGRVSDVVAADRCRCHPSPLKPEVRIDEEEAPPSRPLHFASDAERALYRCFALAAAVTTWCLLQPFILFYILAHFKRSTFHPCSHNSRVLQPRELTFPSTTLSDPTTVIALPLFALSILVGVLIGPRAACEVLRILESGRPPSSRKYWMYGVAMLGTAVLALMPVVLFLGMR